MLNSTERDQSKLLSCISFIMNSNKNRTVRNSILKTAAAILNRTERATKMLKLYFSLNKPLHLK